MNHCCIFPVALAFDTASFDIKGRKRTDMIDFCQLPKD